MAFVTIRIKGTEGYSRTALDKERIVVGRASASDLPIKHTSVSREHVALIRIANGSTEQWAVEDLGSSNGVWVGAEKLETSGRRTLAENDIIKAGKARLTFHSGSLADAEAEAAIILEGAEDAAALTRRRGVDDPPEAIPCHACAGWMSIAHRTAGDNMDCPRCGAANPVPELVDA
jgi:pSer/pThr/pTyr-binding forkhead associated (FHA) protein